MYTCVASGKRSDVYLCSQHPCEGAYSPYKQYRKTIGKNAKWGESNIVNPLLSQVHEFSETLHG